MNIFVVLSGLEVWTERDLIMLSPESHVTLNNFMDYRMKLVRSLPNDNAHLLTEQVFYNGVVGKAQLGPICTHQGSGGIATDHSNTVALVATTIAHEMGHNFGMEHDKDYCECNDCIMSNISSDNPPQHWSSCSIDELNYAIHHGMEYCLMNKPEMIFESPTCGNGFVEKGEECDCGLARDCTNPCCDPHSCRLNDNAKCATGSCCDLTTCTVHKAGKFFASIPN